MLYDSHVRDRRPQPWFAARRAAARELPRGRQGQEPLIANLSKWPSEKVEALRAVLRGDKLAPAGEGLEIVRAVPHGHVAAAFETMKRIGLDKLLPAAPKRKRDLALALIVARLIDPESKLATARALDQETASHSLGALLGLGQVSANDVYEALDWLVARFGGIGNDFRIRFGRDSHDGDQLCRESRLQ